MTTPTPKRGDIWLVEFDPARGAEIHKTRPALVVSADGVGKLPLHIVAPITDWKPAYTNFPWFVQISPDATNGLTKESGVDIFQIKSMSRDRFVQRLGSATSEYLQEVKKALLLCLDLEEHGSG
jgi:mRNA interferase MazF